MDWRTIQKAVGVVPDNNPGPRTAAAVARALGIEEAATPLKPVAPARRFDARSEKNLAGLLPEVEPVFREFLHQAKKIGADWNVSVRIIQGRRSFEEQEALYAQGRTAPGKRVTNAKAGYSWHNFGIAVDLGLFDRDVYVDADQPEIASKIYKQIAVAGRALGLEWGGDWTSFVDEPHWQVKTGLSMEQARRRVAEGRPIV